MRLPPGAGAIWKNGWVRIATSSPVSVPMTPGASSAAADVDRDDLGVRVGRAHEVHEAHVVALHVVDEDALALDEPAVLLARDARPDDPAARVVVSEVTVLIARAPASAALCTASMMFQ